MAGDREFKIRITTEADTAGAREAGRDFDNLGQKGKGAHEEIARGADRAEVSHKALRVILSRLGPEFQELGHLGVVAFSNPLTAGLLGAAVAAGALIKHFEELARASDEAGQRAKEGIDKINESAKAAVVEIGKSDRAFVDWYKHVGEETASVLKDLDSVISKIKEQEELTTKLAKMRNAPGGVDGAIGAGAAGQTREATEAAIRKVSEDLDKASARAVALHLAATDPTREKQIGSLPGIIAASRARAADESGKAEPSAMEVMFGREYFQLHPEDMTEKENQHRTAAETAKSQAERDEQMLQRLTVEKEEAGKERDRAEAHVADLKSQLTQLSGQQEKTGLTSGTRNRLEYEGQRQQLAKMGYKPDSVLGHTILSGIDTANMVGAGGTASADQSAALNALTRALGSNAALVKELFDLSVDTQKKVDDIMKQLGQQKQQSKSGMRPVQ